ncbi:MAG TPA: TrmH family RNA methyltransferase [Vicinamibacteria bacterium]|nr:TrmH family RNA methyltransferase [Vicinamibacteria bacterium]
MVAVRVVLVRPTAPANIGAAARVVRNTGLAGLDLVAPGDWRTLECWRTAWRAQDVLEQARVFDSVPAAIADATYVAGLSGRKPGGAPALEVRDMAGEVAALGPSDRVALVFGPETSGLTDAELMACGRRAFIPSHPRQPSLNLSHAVMVAGYEVYRAGRRPPAPSRRATAAEKEALLALWRAGLLAIEALPPKNPEGAFAAWRALVQRADLTPREVGLFEHVARKMVLHGAGVAAVRGR